MNDDGWDELETALTAYESTGAQTRERQQARHEAIVANDARFRDLVDQVIRPVLEAAQSRITARRLGAAIYYEPPIERPGRQDGRVVLRFGEGFNLRPSLDISGGFVSFSSTGAAVVNVEAFGVPAMSTALENVSEEFVRIQATNAVARYLNPH